MADLSRTAGAFADVFGDRRGRPLNDTLLAREPTEQAERELQALFAAAQADTRRLESLAATVDAHRALVAERPLLRQLRNYVAEEVLAQEYAQAESFVVALLAALAIHDGDLNDWYMRTRCSNVVLRDSEVLGRRALECGGSYMVALREHARAWIEEKLGPALGRYLGGRGLEESLRTLAASTVKKESLRAGPTKEDVQRMARLLRPGDCEALGVTAFAALRGRRPSGGPAILAIRREIAWPVLKEATRLAGIVRDSRQAEAAEKGRQANEFLRAECERIARVSAALPENVSASEVLRAYAGGGFTAEDERGDVQQDAPYVIRADRLYHAAKPGNRTSISRQGLTADRDGEVFVTRGLSGYSDNPKYDLWEVDPSGLVIESEDVGEDELVIMGAVPAVNLRLVVKAEDRPRERPQKTLPGRDRATAGPAAG